MLKEVMQNAMISFLQLGMVTLDKDNMSKVMENHSFEMVHEYAQKVFNLLKHIA